MSLLEKHRPEDKSIKKFPNRRESPKPYRFTVLNQLGISAFTWVVTSREPFSEEPVSSVLMSPWDLHEDH